MNNKTRAEQKKIDKIQRAETVAKPYVDAPWVKQWSVDAPWVKQWSYLEQCFPETHAKDARNAAVTKS